MQYNTLREATAVLARNRRRRAWKKVVGVLACIVVFCTTYALILPAITKEKDTYCGIALHQHGAECYEAVLTCGQEETESEAHVHTEECYAQNPVCGKEEHAHTLGCYSNPEADVESAESWSHSVSGVELTSNWRRDLIAVTGSQLGYQESGRNYAVAEDGETKKGYTRYGAWYGDSYGDWSAMFVSFCLHYAGIPTECFPQEADCSAWVDKLQSEEYGLYSAATGEYQPMAGDLVFFDRDGDGSSDHVGLVAERIVDEQGTPTGIKTIEGDVGDQVKYGICSVEDETILGYGILPDNPNQTQSSDSMAAASSPADLDGQCYVLFNPKHMRVVLATSNRTAGFLDAAEVRTDSDENGVYVYALSAGDQEEPNYQLWTFQRIDPNTNTYYVKTTVSDQVKYLTIDGGSVTVEDFITDDADRNAKQVITVTGGTGEFAGQVRLTNAAGQAVNKYYGKEYFGGWNGNNEDEYFYLAVQRPVAQAGTVEGVTPNGTVINVFDYWLTDQISTNSGGDLGEKNKPDAGINAGHALKFTPDGFGETTNKWTGSSAPRKGLVEHMLGEDGYPILTAAAAAESGTNDLTAESLAYLFDPDKKYDDIGYRKTFRNVGGLLRINTEGYYYYDSTQNFAQLNEQTGMFTLYDTWGVVRKKAQGQFFPFNKLSESQYHSSESAEINHYFGLTMTSRFVQRYDGHTNSSRTTATTFEFSGDDDVWVFIDGVLVGDLGGIHDRATLKIDFASGDVFINNKQVRTLKEAFVQAGKEIKDDEWSVKEPDTFADNTYHTLKFYYLERGNYDSNMMLKYNLTAVPETSIYKVDQYGTYLRDVEFKVYKANAAWEYDPTQPVYTGKTDINGKLTFVDDDNMPYTLKELREIFGEYCVMKETKAPPGYRLVNTETRLHVSERALWCENTYDSGVWAMITLRVAAPPTLKLWNRPNEPEQNYYAFDNATKTQGTLFGIVVKRVGNEDVAKLNSWAPVSGNSKEGFTVHKVTGATAAEHEDNFIRKAIEIAQEKNTVFQMAASGAMELTMTNLPGHVMEYYYMLDEADKQNAEFTTVYYWTEGTLAEATADNTFRVNSDAMAPNAFDRTFGAVIEVPNLCNRLLVQKYADDGKTMVDGAIFALFKANMDGTYLADDGTSVTLVEGEYTTEVHFSPNANEESYAIIRLADGRTITSVEQRRTNSTVLEGAKGTCVFGIRDKPLLEGCYYLREVKAPIGYKINTTPVMVRVTDQAIYANAGVEDDGVEVARGPGYIVATLHKAASSGDIDNTLTWLYQWLHVSAASTSFADAVPGATGIRWDYARFRDPDNPKNIDNGKILASYLYYDRTPKQLGEQKFLANFEVDKNEARPAIAGTLRTHTLQLSTDVGWSFNAIYQDYDYGVKHLKEIGSNANYTNLSGKNIYNLFSRSVYVRVTDQEIFSDLEISKTVENGGAPTGGNFVFTVAVESATDTYDYTVYSDATKTRVFSTGTFTNGGTITLKSGQVAVIHALPGRAEYTVTEAPASGYIPRWSVDGAALTEGNVAAGTLNWGEAEEERVSRVAFTNTYAPPLNLTLYKYERGTENPLSGAKFVLYTAVGNMTYYYKAGADGEVGQWVMLTEGQTEESLALTTPANGTIRFTGIPDGTYHLKEIAAPNGYQLPKNVITFTVTGEKIDPGSTDGAAFTENTVTVYNSTSHRLPQTGGTGTVLYTTGGLLLMAAAMLLLYSKKKRGKEDKFTS